MDKKIDVFQKYGIDKENEVIQTSLTKNTYLRENNSSTISEDYQRLEFLGDRVVGLIIAELLYKSKKRSEGIMSQEFQIITTNSKHYEFSKILRFR